MAGWHDRADRDLQGPFRRCEMGKHSIRNMATGTHFRSSLGHGARKRASPDQELVDRSRRLVARALAWIGIFAIIVLSVVPAVDRPVTGLGQWFEHFTAFALVGGAFTIGYRLSLIRLLLLAFFFCGVIELLHPLPTRHARISDLVVDSCGVCFALGCAAAGDKLIGADRRQLTRTCCRRRHVTR